jgi:hypothetical protein
MWAGTLKGTAASSKWRHTIRNNKVETQEDKIVYQLCLAMVKVKRNHLFQGKNSRTHRWHQWTSTKTNKRSHSMKLMMRQL